MRPAAEDSPAPKPATTAARTNDFPAVPLDPGHPYDQIRTLYIRREPELLAAIRAGDRREARKIINHILVHIYSAGQERSELLKGLMLELVVMMTRAAVEAGASQSDVLGLNFERITELAGMDDDEALAEWLRRTFERIFTVVGRRSRSDPRRCVTRAIAWMRENLGHSVARDEVADHAGVSAGHLSILLRRETGLGFADLLRQLRVDAAAVLLRDTDRKLSDVAAACGFCDQSHLSHAFQRARGRTPRQFREEAASLARCGPG